MSKQQLKLCTPTLIQVINRKKSEQYIKYFSYVEYQWSKHGLYMPFMFRGKPFVINFDYEN